MEPTTILIAAGLHAASVVYRNIEDDLATRLWRRWVDAFLKRRGSEPDPQAVLTLTASDVTDMEQVVPDLEPSLGHFLAESTALRRAERVADSLRGARILWVDDHPENNRWEAATFRALGCEVVAVDDSNAAESLLRVGRWDLMVSDIAREREPTAGLDMLSQLRSAGTSVPLVFYVGSVDPEKSIPVGAHGITARPDELLHLALDVLERSRI